MSFTVNHVGSARIARFGRGGAIVRSNAPLDNDTMRRAAPSIFADDKHSSRSERYTYIPTVRVLEGMRQEGFLPFEVRQGGSGDADKRVKTKHMIRFRKEGVAMRDVGDSMREVVLVNSHDGTSSYQLMSGVFRLVCSNGMVVADDKGAMAVRIPHKGDIIRDVIDAAYTIIDDGVRVDRQIADMRGVTLSRGEQEIFAESALIARFGEDRPALEPRQIIQPRRSADVGDDLWMTFNRAQENLTHGGLAYVTRDERGRVRQHRHTRPVNSIDGDTNLNRALWTLAARMAELKA